jgi:hypothetical protein
VISMLEFLIDNIFVSFGGTLFQQADLFLYSYESEFLQTLVVFNLSWGRVVYRVEKSNVLMEDT